MSGDERDGLVILDLNNAVFQENLLDLEKHDRHSAFETLKKLRKVRWGQVYRDQGLKWEKIVGAKQPAGASAVYSLRITRSRRATACREGDVMRILTIPADDDAAYGKK